MATRSRRRGPPEPAGTLLDELVQANIRLMAAKSLLERDLAGCEASRELAAGLCQRAQGLVDDIGALLGGSLLTDEDLSAFLNGGLPPATA